MAPAPETQRWEHTPGTQCIASNPLTRPWLPAPRHVSHILSTRGDRPDGNGGGVPTAGSPAGDAGEGGRATQTAGRHGCCGSAGTPGMCVIREHLPPPPPGTHADADADADTDLKPLPVPRRPAASNPEHRELILRQRFLQTNTHNSGAEGSPRERHMCASMAAVFSSPSRFHPGHLSPLTASPTLTTSRGEGKGTQKTGAQVSTLPGGSGLGPGGPGGASGSGRTCPAAQDSL